MLILKYLLILHLLQIILKVINKHRHHLIWIFRMFLIHSNNSKRINNFLHLKTFKQEWIILQKVLFKYIINLENLIHRQPIQILWIQFLQIIKKKFITMKNMIILNTPQKILMNKRKIWDIKIVMMKTLNYLDRLQVSNNFRKIKRKKRKRRLSFRKLKQEGLNN